MPNQRSDVIRRIAEIALHNFVDQVIGLSTYYLVMEREKRGCIAFQQLRRCLFGVTRQRVICKEAPHNFICGDCHCCLTNYGFDLL
jgi:hypothetical protein